MVYLASAEEKITAARIRFDELYEWRFHGKNVKIISLRHLRGLIDLSSAN